MNRNALLLVAMTALLLLSLTQVAAWRSHTPASASPAAAAPTDPNNIRRERAALAHLLDDTDTDTRATDSQSDSSASSR